MPRVIGFDSLFLCAVRLCLLRCFLHKCTYHLSWNASPPLKCLSFHARCLYTLLCNERPYFAPVAIEERAKRVRQPGIEPGTNRSLQHLQSAALPTELSPVTSHRLFSRMPVHGLHFIFVTSPWGPCLGIHKSIQSLQCTAITPCTTTLFFYYLFSNLRLTGTSSEPLTLERTDRCPPAACWVLQGRAAATNPP